MGLEEPPQPPVSAATDNAEKVALQDNAKAEAIESSAETSKEVVIEAGQDGETDKKEKEEQGGSKDYFVTFRPSFEFTSLLTLYAGTMELCRTR
jgi:hypothetical protein